MLVELDDVIALLWKKADEVGYVKINKLVEMLETELEAADDDLLECGCRNDEFGCQGYHGC